MKNKILMIISQNNFRDEEYLIPKDFFLSLGFQVNTASKKIGVCTSFKGENVEANVLVYDFKLSDYDAIVFVGGKGALDYENDEKVLEIVKQAFAQDRLIGAICIAPRILGAAHILKNKNFTMWNEDGSQEDFMYEWDGIYTAEDVEIDENIVTASGPRASKKFAEAILKQIK